MAIPRLTYPQTSDNFIEGQITSTTPPEIVTLPNSAADTGRSAVITPGVGTQEVTVYRLIERYSGQTVTFTSDATPTAQEVSDGLRAAIRANAVLNGMVTVAGTTTVTIAARTGVNAPFDFGDNGSTPTNTLAVVTTAATDTALLPFGRAVTSSTTKPDTIRLINATLSATNILRGFTCYTPFGLTDQIPTADGYTARRSVNVLTRGQLAVKCLTAYTPLSQVWLVFSGANAGLIRTSDSGGADNIQIFEGISFANSGAAGSIAKIDINLPSYRLA